MKVKDALVRAARTLGQNSIPVVGAFFAAVGAGGFASIKDAGKVLALGAFVAVGGAVVSFLQNVTEENTDVDLGPRG